MKTRRFKKLRVAVLCHENLIPPDSLEGYTEKQIIEWKTEYDVVQALKGMGHDVYPVGLSARRGAAGKTRSRSRSKSAGHSME